MSYGRCNRSVRKLLHEHITSRLSIDLRRSSTKFFENEVKLVKSNRQRYKYNQYKSLMISGDCHFTILSKALSF